MSTVHTKPLTAEEFFDYQPESESGSDVFHELDRGEIVEMSPTGARHGLICANIGWVLSDYVRRRGQGFGLSNNAGLILERDPDTVFGPDVSYFDEPRRYDEIEVKYSKRMPTLAVEVLSPSDRFGKTAERVARFLAAGIPLVWIVDPEARDVTVYRSGREPVVLAGADRVVAEDILPGFDVPVADFFSRPSGPPGGSTALD
ncbi:MAG: Uma2 family endonuclease [Planctomycetales bacterium]